MYTPGLFHVTLNHIQLSQLFSFVCLLFYGAGKAATECLMYQAKKAFFFFWSLIAEVPELSRRSEAMSALFNAEFKEGTQFILDSL